MSDPEVELQEEDPGPTVDFEFLTHPAAPPVTGNVPRPPDGLIRVNTAVGTAFARVPEEGGKVVISFYEVPAPPPETPDIPEGEVESVEPESEPPAGNGGINF